MGKKYAAVVAAKYSNHTERNNNGERTFRHGKVVVYKKYAITKKGDPETKR